MELVVAILERVSTRRGLVCGRGARFLLTTHGRAMVDAALWFVNAGARFLRFFLIWGRNPRGSTHLIGSTTTATIHRKIVGGRRLDNKRATQESDDCLRHSGGHSTSVNGQRKWGFASRLYGTVYPLAGRQSAPLQPKCARHVHAVASKAIRFA